MPAKSEKQRRYLNAKFGHAWVKKHHFDNKGKLPERVKKSSDESFNKKLETVLNEMFDQVDEENSEYTQCLVCKRELMHDPMINPFCCSRCENEHYEAMKDDAEYRHLTGEPEDTPSIDPEHYRSGY